MCGSIPGGREAMSTKVADTRVNWWHWHPDVILAAGTYAAESLLQATRTIPIVFNNVADPVGAGLVKSMARPGGNTTGFIQFEYSLSGKWLELLKQIAPSVTRVAVLRDAAITSGLANSP